MRNARLIALLSGIATAGAPAAAQSLEEALSLAYETNPTIAAERARQREGRAFTIR
ncbi:MAG TPA: hypothetical protein PKH09_05890 [Parvularculaceae bacterium]|nr:hypothetical protein [Parvularculaceae bacterium]